MKTKLKVNFNGTNQGHILQVKTDPNKRIFVTQLVRKGHHSYCTGQYNLGNDEYINVGPCFYRDYHYKAYEWINGQAIVVDEVILKRYGTTHNFYLAGNEEIETHFAWVDEIQKYAETFNCAINVETKYNEQLSKSFPNLNFFLNMPEVMLRDNYIGYNIGRDYSFEERYDHFKHKTDIQFYSWFNPRPPHKLSDRELFSDIVYGPDLNNPIYGKNMEDGKTAQQMLDLIFLGFEE